MVYHLMMQQRREVAVEYLYSLSEKMTDSQSIATGCIIIGSGCRNAARDAIAPASSHIIVLTFPLTLNRPS